MHQRREHEDDASLLERTFHRRRRHLDRDAQRLEYVGASALRGERPVAMLGDSDAGAGSKQCRRRRDVERGDGAAAGSAGIDERIRVRVVQHDHRIPHRPGDRGDFVRCLSLDAEANQQGGDLHGRRVASHDEGERGRQLGRGGRFPGDQSLDDRRNERRRSGGHGERIAG